MNWLRLAAGAVVVIAAFATGCLCLSLVKSYGFSWLVVLALMMAGAGLAGAWKAGI